MPASRHFSSVFESRQRRAHSAGLMGCGMKWLRTNCVESTATMGPGEPRRGECRVLVCGSMRLEAADHTRSQKSPLSRLRGERVEGESLLECECWLPRGAIKQRWICGAAGAPAVRPGSARTGCRRWCCWRARPARPARLAAPHRCPQCPPPARSRACLRRHYPR